MIPATEKCVCGVALTAFEQPLHRVHRLVAWYGITEESARVLVYSGKADLFEETIELMV